MKDLKMTRRAALGAAAAAPLAVASVSSVRANEGAPAPVMAKQNTFELGDFRVSTLLAGTRTINDDPQGLFAIGVDRAEFEAASFENFIPADRAQGFFTPTVVQTGSETVLFDTGISAVGVADALAQAGLTPADITVVVITHMHGDHIGGMTTESGDLAYPNARFVTGQAEFDFWANAENDTFAAKVEPFADRFSFIGDENDVVSGISGMAAFGHTPGHMVYRIASGGEQIVVMADTTNHPVWSLANPDWPFRFDMDKDAAIATRKRLLSMLAAERMPMIGYHMPFPGIGFVDTRGDGFHYVPATYQMML